MLISLDWIKDFTNIPTDLSAEELGTRLTMATAEVEEVCVVGDYWEKIRVVEVLEKEKHPEADKLNLVTFRASDKETFKVVCGASNVRIGMKTPYAPTGVTLPNGLTLEPKKIRGFLSEGMLCSEEELGLSESSEGILELPNDAPLGETLLSYFKDSHNASKDILLDIDNKSLTHRPDLWGHYGIAREFSAIFRNELKDPFSKKWEASLEEKMNKSKASIEIEVEESSSCLGYFGLSLEDVEVEESPNWLKTRLKSVGLRPINNIVDISNYVMFELGHPLHIFDRDEIKGNKVVIKQLGSQCRFKTLDEIDRELISSDTVICDEDGALVIAGIMGGLKSGVSEKTKNIFVEVANWKASEVRKTSTRLGLRTDSSQRFEKTLDSLQMRKTILRTLELILKLCPKAQVIGNIQYAGTDLSQIDPLKITLSHDRLIKVLGHSIEISEVKAILEHLDFKTSEEKGIFIIDVPSYRSTKDIECEADIIEEIGRIIGYDNISPTSPLLDIVPVRRSWPQELHSKIRNFMAFSARSFEINTYAMIGEKLLNKASWPNKNEPLKLINSLSKEHDRMRPSLVPSFLEAAGLNAKNHQEFRFFEVGRRYIQTEKKFAEDISQLGIAFYNKDKSVFLDLVNNVESGLNAWGISAELTQKNPKFSNEVIDENWVGLHPFEFYNIKVMGKMKGIICTLHPLMARQFKIKGHLSMAFIDLNTIEARVPKSKMKYKALPKFPDSVFDCTVTVDESIQVQNILDSLNKLKIKELISKNILDVFRAKDSNEKNVTLRFIFQDDEKTLSGELIKLSESTIVAQLENSGFPLKQG